MTYVYGPVYSRRLGASLGIEAVPPLTCTFDCIYCQLGRTENKVSGRKEVDQSEFPEPKKIVTQVEEALENYEDVEYVTISGSGEPTLNPKLSELRERLRAVTELPLALITNSSLLTRNDILRTAKEFDLVLPSLDAGDQDTFEAINRPAEGFEIDEIAEGLAHLCDSTATVWVEVMLLKSERFRSNSSGEAIERIAAKLGEMSPDQVHLNTCVRPPVEKVDPLSPPEMTQAKELLCTYLPSALQVEIISARTSRGARLKDEEKAEKEIESILKIRPCTARDIANSTGLNLNEVSKQLQKLARQGKLAERRRESKTYYRWQENRPK